jgi:hypothetical protein
VVSYLLTLQRRVVSYLLTLQRRVVSYLFTLQRRVVGYLFTLQRRVVSYLFTLQTGTSGQLYNPPPVFYGYVWWRVAKIEKLYPCREWNPGLLDLSRSLYLLSYQSSTSKFLYEVISITYRTEGFLHKQSSRAQ